MTIFNIYSGQLGDSQFLAISKAIDSSLDKTILGSSQIVPILVSAMARIARSEQGAQALSNMIDHDHNGSILAKLPALYANPAIANGDMVVTNILGDKRADAQELVSRESGLSAAATSKLFAITTPIVLGMIGLKKHQDKIGPAMLSQMLTTFAERHEREERGEEEPAAVAQEDSFFGKIPGMASLAGIGGMLKSGNFQGIGKLVTNLLDKNKDGSVMDDLQGIAGSLFSGKK